MLGFALRLVASNAGEWLIHKYVLHGLGRNKQGYWAFHWHEHHRTARRAGGADPAYREPFWRNRAKRREVLGLVSNAAFVTPLLPFAPGFVGGGLAEFGRVLLRAPSRAPRARVGAALGALALRPSYGPAAARQLVRHLPPMGMSVRRSHMQPEHPAACDVT